MFTLSIIVAAIVVAVLMFGASSIMKWVRFIKLARKLPSPKTVPFVGHIEAITAQPTDVDRLLEKYFLEFPRMFTAWIGPVPMLFLRDPRDIEIILRSEIRNVKKSFPYYILGQLMGDGLTILEGNKWEVHRKLLDPAFHLKFLENSVKIFARESEILIQKLEKEIGQQSFDVKTYFNRVIVNIVTSAISEDVTILDEEGVNECIEKLQQAHKLFMLRAMSPWLYPDFIYWRTSNGRKSKEIIEFSKKLAQDISNCKREKLAREKKSRTANVEGELLGKKKMPTFLDLLLNATDYGVQLSEKDISNEIRTFIVAAFDTVNVTLCWLMQVLGNHLEIQDKVYEEIENVLHGSNRLITMKDLNEMNYLERVIKEVQRLHSPVPLLSRTITKDLEIGGHTVPEGMIINIPTCQVHKNPEIYQNPEKFDPDRFLPESESNYQYAYIPFSAGPRSCIGKKFAMLEMKTLLSYIIRNYKIYSLREKLTPITEIVLGSKEGFYISIQKRNPKNGM